MLQTIWRDIRYAARGLWQTRGFTAIAILTIALGMAGPSLIFSLAHWTLLRPVPGVQEPERVVDIASGIFNDRGYRVNRIAYEDYFALRDSLKTLDIAGYQTSSLAVATSQRPARSMMGQFVTDSFFPVLGIRMHVGRAFTAEEDRPGAAARVVVISERAWAELFDRSPAVLQQPIRINGHVFTIVGVTGDGFGGLSRTDASVDAWLPGTTSYLVNHIPSRPGMPSAPGYYQFVGRLRPGVAPEQAGTELHGVAEWLVRRDPERNENFTQATVRVQSLVGDGTRDRTIEFLTPMVTGTLVLLLIASSNVATMMLVRGTTRFTEIAVRRALGSGTLSLLRQGLLEGAMVWAIGGGVALLLVVAVTQTISGYTLIGARGPDAAVPVDWRVIAFTATLSLGTGLVFSVLPTLRSLRADPSLALKAGNPSHTMQNRPASILAAVQLGASLALLVAALLMTTTVRQLSAVDVGVDPQRVHIVNLNPAAAGYRGERAEEFVQRFLTRVTQAPGVERAGAASQPPILVSAMTTAIKPPQDPQSKFASDAAVVLSPGFLAASGIPIVKGRDFTEEDFGAGRAREVVIVNERFARAVFGDAEPVGRTIEYWGLTRRGRPFEVIGVARDVRGRSLTVAPQPMVYELPDPGFVPSPTFVVRMRDDTDPTVLLQAAGAQVDPNVPVERVQSLQGSVDAQRQPWLVISRLMTVLALVAALLSGVGLAAVVSAGIVARLREVAIRVALGATPMRVARYAVRRTVALCAVGLIIGSAGAASIARVLRNRLFGVEPFDPLVWMLASVGLIAIAVAASWIPVRRAIHLDVMRTLRV
jgi:predicted permease